MKVNRFNERMSDNLRWPIEGEKKISTFKICRVRHDNSIYEEMKFDELEAAIEFLDSYEEYMERSNEPRKWKHSFIAEVTEIFKPISEEDINLFRDSGKYNL